MASAGEEVDDNAYASSKMGDHMSDFPPSADQRRETALQPNDGTPLPLTLPCATLHPGMGAPISKTNASTRRRSRDTRPELLIRKALFDLGLRYRVNFPVPGFRRRSMDIAFPRRQVAVFVDGCFWHGCPVHFNSPRTNTDFWVRQVSLTRDRDSETNAWLRDAGWIVMRFWEHQDSDEASATIFSEVTNQDFLTRTGSR